MSRSRPSAGVWVEVRGIGDHPARFDDIQLTVVFLDQVEMAILQGDGPDAIALLQDIGKTEPDIETLGFIERPGARQLVRVELHFVQPDRDIREILKDRDIAAANGQLSRQPSVQLAHRQVDEPLLLGIQDGDSDTDQEYDANKGKEDKPDYSLACFRGHR